MNPGIIILLVIAAIVVLFAAAASRGERFLAKEWRVEMEGDYDRVEYGYYDYTTRSGAMVHTTHHHRMDVTAFYLADGRCCTAKGRYDMPFTRGTRIRIWRNGLEQIKIEQL